MKSSTTSSTIFYPDNRALDPAVERAAALVAGGGGARDDGQTEAGSLSIARSAGDSDPLQKNTLGNFEHSNYSVAVIDAARAQLETALTDELRQQTPTTWAAIENDLGTLLATLAQARGDGALLERAVEAFNNALEVYTEEAFPSDWAATQSKLGLVLQASGRDKQDAKSLTRSVDAFTAALTVWTRQQAPEEWALAMHHLGTTLYLQGALLKGNRTLQKSVVAFKNALAEFNADRDPLEYAISLGNRGAVLQALAESEQNPERVEEALRSYEPAHLVMQEQQRPIHLAQMVRINIAAARNLLAEMSKDAAPAREAEEELEVILAVSGGSIHPDCVKRGEQLLTQAQELIEALG